MSHLWSAFCALEPLPLGSSPSHLHSLVLQVKQVEIGGLQLCFHLYHSLLYRLVPDYECKIFIYKFGKKYKEANINYLNLIAQRKYHHC